MHTKPVISPCDQRLTMIDDIINTLSRRVQKITRPCERDELLKDIAYFNLYRRNILHDITTNNFAATYGNRSTSVNE